jgi:hypothetical protein
MFDSNTVEILYHAKKKLIILQKKISAKIELGQHKNYITSCK